MFGLLIIIDKIHQRKLYEIITHDGLVKSPSAGQGRKIPVWGGYLNSLQMAEEGKLSPAKQKEVNLLLQGCQSCARIKKSVLGF